MPPTCPVSTCMQPGLPPSSRTPLPRPLPRTIRGEAFPLRRTPSAFAPCSDPVRAQFSPPLGKGDQQLTCRGTSSQLGLKHDENRRNRALQSNINEEGNQARREPSRCVAKYRNRRKHESGLEGLVGPGRFRLLHGAAEPVRMPSELRRCPGNFENLSAGRLRDAKEIPSFHAD